MDEPRRRNRNIGTSSETGSRGKKHGKSQKGIESIRGALNTEKIAGSLKGALNTQRRTERVERTERTERTGRSSGSRRRKGIWNLDFRQVVIANIVLFGLLIGGEAWSASQAKISFDAPEKNAVEVEFGSEFDVSNVVATYSEPLHPSRKQVVECTYDGDLNTKKMGKYTVTVEAAYKKAKSKLEETVTVVDRTAPEITLQGSETESVMAGHVFRDPGYEAKDLLDGDLTEQVEISGNVDLMTPGTYERVYTVTDAHGNTATRSRTVVVTENDGSGISEELEAKTIYLTFDDGPWKYTEELLDILDKYNAKVTFFVTNQYPDYIDLIAEEAKRGHTVAVHTYSHDYGKIYRSTQAFYEDMDKMAAIIKEQTGEQPWLSRFPGGGSNTISRKYCDGIMTALTNGLADHGYLYADWNVVSGDAGDTTSTDKVISNVINGVQQCSGAAIVLQHDIKDFSVAAVESILKWGQENGYVFRAMTELSTMPHQSVNN